MKYDWIDAYLLAKKGVQKDFKAEWNWLRYMVGDKLFAAVCYDDKTNRPALITLKLTPNEGDFLLREYDDIIPGYYMNKTHWNSVKADGDIQDDMLKDLLDRSYDLVLHGLSKKKQAEILQ